MINNDSKNKNNLDNLHETVIRENITYGKNIQHEILNQKYKSKKNKILFIQLLINNEQFQEWLIIHGTKFCIGRAVSSDIQIDDNTTSRNHITIKNNDNNFSMQDISKNGSLLDNSSMTKNKNYTFKNTKYKLRIGNSEILLQSIEKNRLQKDFFTKNSNIDENSIRDIKDIILKIKYNNKRYLFSKTPIIFGNKQENSISLANNSILNNYFKDFEYKIKYNYKDENFKLEHIDTNNTKNPKIKKQITEEIIEKDMINENEVCFKFIPLN